MQELAKSNGSHSVRARTMYSELRRNVVSTVYNSWKDTHFAWEQYNPETGAGQRTQHFTGWTSLVVKIMAMPDLEPHETQPGMPSSHYSWLWSQNTLVLVLMLSFLAYAFRRKLSKLAGFRLRFTG